MAQFAKKLSIQMDIADLQQNAIQHLNTIFQSYKGENTVAFEIIEQEKIKKITEIVSKVEVDEEVTFDAENLENIDIEIPAIEIENQIITKVTLPSRKLKIKISNELLQELEKMELNFRLN